MSGHTPEQLIELNAICDRVLTQSTNDTKEAVKETIDERFTAYGFDIKTPVEIQKNMAFLDKLRKLVDSLILKAVAVIIAAVGVGSIVWTKFVKGD